MHSILKELNLPGSTTRPVVIPRKLNQSSTSKKVELQLALPIILVEHKSNNKE